MTIKKFGAAVALWFLSTFSAVSYAQGIPTYDNANFLGNTLNEIQNIEQYVAQYNSLVQQYNQAVQQFHSLNGIRNFQSLLNNPLIRSYLPQQWATMYDSVMTTTNCVQYASNAGQFANCARTAKRAVDQQIQQNMQSQITQRKTDIQSLINQLANAPDAKDTADLTARINGEQANLAAEQAELEAYDRASKAQAQANEEATVDALTKRATVTLSNPFTSMPTSATSSGQ